MGRILRRKPAIIPGCSHANAVRVEASEELVAGLCPDCDVQLSAEWFTCDHADAETVTVHNKVIRSPEFGYSERLARRRCPTCGSDWWAPRVFADWVRWL